MGHRIGTHLPGNVHQTAGNQGASQGRGKGIAPLVESIGPNGGKGEFGDEGFNQIIHDRLAGAGVEGLLTNRLQLIALAQIGSKGNHLLHAPFLHQIGNADAGVDPA